MFRQSRCAAGLSARSIAVVLLAGGVGANTAYAADQPAAQTATRPWRRATQLDELLKEKIHGKEKQRPS